MGNSKFAFIVIERLRKSNVQYSPNISPKSEQSKYKSVPVLINLSLLIVYFFPLKEISLLLLSIRYEFSSFTINPLMVSNVAEASAFICKNLNSSVMGNNSFPVFSSYKGFKEPAPNPSICRFTGISSIVEACANTLKECKKKSTNKNSQLN